MTYREKFKELYPNVSTEDRCPALEFENEIVPKDCVESGDFCEECWDKEIDKEIE